MSDLVRQAIEKGIAALAAIDTSELLVASRENIRSFDSPFTAAFVLSALADGIEPRLHEITKPCIEYLLRTLERPGLWRFSKNWPTLPLPLDADDSACALAALKRYEVSEVAYESALDVLLASADMDGRCRTWLIRDGEILPGGENEVDVVVNVNVLFLAALLGRQLPDVSSFVTDFVKRNGLNCGVQSIYYSSPFVFAYFLSRWLRQTRSFHGLRESVFSDCMQRLNQAMLNPLDCALAVNCLLSLEFSIQKTVLDEMIAFLVREQSAIGLWPALPMFIDPEGKAYGSIQMTTAVCLETLDRYARAPASGERRLFLTGGTTSSPMIIGSRVKRPATCDPKGRDATGRPRRGTLEATFKALMEVTPPRLVTQENFANLRAMFGSLPGALTSVFGFECRLARSLPYADFSLCIKGEGIGPEILADIDPYVQLPEALFSFQIWQRIREFSREWIDEASILNRGIVKCWLEFDIDGRPSKVPAPNVFLDLDETRMPNDGAAAEEVVNRQQAIIENAFQLLGRDSLFQKHSRAIKICFRAVPAGGHVFSVGVLLARQTDAIRLCIKDIPSHRLLGYLSDIGWPGPFSELDELISELSGLVDRIHLGIDVCDRILPTIGLECSMSDHKQLPDDRKWLALFDHLVERGLCLPEKRDALLDWYGSFHCTEEVEDELLEGHFDKLFSHVKISLKENSKAEAKAYFAASRFSEIRRRRIPMGEGL